jgi:hypothetical protein
MGTVAGDVSFDITLTANELLREAASSIAPFRQAEISACLFFL